MKKYILPILFLCSFAWFLYGFMYIGGKPPSVPSGGDILNETFDSAGFDDASWGAIQEGGTNDMDADSTNAASGTGFSGQWLDHDRNEAWEDCYVDWDDGASTHAVVYISLYVYVDDSSDGVADIIEFKDSGGTRIGEFALVTSGGSPSIRWVVGNTVDWGDVAISYDTAYKCQMYLNSGGGWSIDVAGTTDSGAGDPGNDFDNFRVGAPAADGEANYRFYVDTFDIDSSGFIN